MSRIRLHVPPKHATVDALYPVPLHPLFTRPGRFGFHRCPGCGLKIKWALVYCVDCTRKYGSHTLFEERPR